jgi:hypothetical protein
MFCDTEWWYEPEDLPEISEVSEWRLFQNIGAMYITVMYLSEAQSSMAVSRK